MKGSISSRGFKIFLIAVVAFSMCEMIEMANGAPSAAECKEERRLAVNACKAVLYGRNPTPACCVRARVSHVECICPAVTPERAALVDVNRAVRLIQGCGRKVPRHFKCGSITTP